MVLEAEAGCSQMTDLLSNIKQNEKYIDQSEREGIGSRITHACMLLMCMYVQPSKLRGRECDS